MPLGDWRAVEIRGLRIAFYTHHEFAAPSAETAATCRRAAAALAGLGAGVVEALPPRIEEAYAISRHYWQRPESESPAEWRPDGEFSLSSEQIERHLFEWDRFRQALIGFMGDYDAILTPVAELPAMPAGPTRAASTPCPTA